MSFDFLVVESSIFAKNLASRKAAEVSFDSPEASSSGVKTLAVRTNERPLLRHRQRRAFQHSAARQPAFAPKNAETNLAANFAEAVHLAEFSTLSQR